MVKLRASLIASTVPIDARRVQIDGRRRLLLLARPHEVRRPDQFRDVRVDRPDVPADAEPNICPCASRGSLLTAEGRLLLPPTYFRRAGKGLIPRRKSWLRC